MRPGRSRGPPWRSKNASRPVPARKQRSCESGVRATDSPSRSASSRTCGFVSSPSGKRIRAMLAGASAASMYAWSLAGSAAARISPSVADARVVTGGERRRAEPLARGRASRRAARSRCSARTGSASGPRRGRRSTGRRRRRGTRRAGRASGAAGPSSCASERARRTALAEQQERSASLCGVAPQLERDGDRLRAVVVRAEQRRDGAVDAAGHRDERARADRRRAARRRGPRCRARARARRPPGRRRGACRGSGRRARPRPRRSRSARRRGSCAPSASSTAALAAAIVAPQPSASKPASVTSPPLDREIEAHDVAAGGRPGGRGVRPGGHVTAPVREPQMLLEALVRHHAGV